jgi:hypothetical protein
MFLPSTELVKFRMVYDCFTKMIGFCQKRNTVGLAMACFQDQV